MITETDDIQKISTLMGEDVAMTIDAESLAHIISVLTGLYEDLELASLREICSNARDSHIAAGVTRPIKVCLPTPLACYLTVQDFGLGLDADDFRNIYSKYGASTKRESNDFVGMLGLGCKAPLAYADQFTIVGTKNGVMTTVTISRDEDDGATMTILDESPTDEGNGVTVTIPTKRVNNFAYKAKEFFKYWPKGSVLVNGQEPEALEGISLTDEVMLVNGDYYDENIIVMGDVPYEVGRTINGIPNDYHIVAFLPIGSVTPVPSREGLKDNKQKIAALEAIEQVVKDKLVDAVQASIDKADNISHALKLAVNYREILGKRKVELSYKGVILPRHFRIEDDETQRFITTFANSSPMSRVYRERSIAASSISDGKYLFVHGYDRPTFTAGQKKKLVKHAEDNNIEVDVWILHEDKSVLPAKFLDPSRVVHWDEIKNIKLPRTNNGSSTGFSSRLAGSYDGYVEGSWITEIPADDIDTTDLYYMNTSYETNWKSVCRLLARQRPHGTIIPMSGNRIDKFLRNFPGARNVTEELRDIFEVEIVNMLTEDDAMAYYLSDNWRTKRNVEALNPDKIDDPDLANFVRIGQADNSLDNINLMNKFLAHRYTLGIHKPTIAEIEDPFAKYPLFDYCAADEEHLHFYINACYAARKDS